MRTPIAYYGGKQAIADQILPLIPAHKVYSEVFFGGGTIFFAKSPAESETINDRLDIVINFYKVLKCQFNALKKMVDCSLVSRSMHKEALCIVKGVTPADDVKRAWAFWFVCNFSFANKIGAGIKYSNDQNSSVPNTMNNKKKEFCDFLSRRIEMAYIENNDALTVLKSRNIKQAFHYLYPPYMNADQGHYSGYTINDFEALLDFCANEMTGKFLLSNYPSDILTEYVKKNGWFLKELNHSSKHGAHVKHRKKEEIIVSNYPFPDYYQQQLFDSCTQHNNANQKI